MVERLDPVEDYNFEHFRIRHMPAELLRTGLPPGTPAPDFELPSTDGARIRLSELRGTPVLLHFVTYTCPVTRDGVTAMRELEHLYKDRLRIIEALIRQAHPGERHSAYHGSEGKVLDAYDYADEEAPSGRY